MSDQEEQQEKRKFKVEDRRRFSETGELRPEQEAKPTEAPAVPEEQPASSSAAAGTSSPQGSPESTALPLTFSTFVLSLSTQALAHLGEIPNPLDNKVSMDLPAARQMIDILGILKDKTKGNLDNSESGLLENVLYDLRLKYVERARYRS